MALAAGTSARAYRLIALVATLLLAAATALAFGRVFIGAETTMKLLAAALAAGLLAVALERRSLLLATLASAAGLALAVGWIVFPETLWYGLPTADTLRAALDAAAIVGEQARIQAAPAEPNAPLLLAGVVSLWAAVFSAHALAFRAGSPLLGLIPPVALLAFADTVLEEFVKPVYGLAFLAAALLVVFADGLARIQGWGPVWSSATRGVAGSAGRGARRLGFAALAAAIMAPIVIPGFGSKAVVDFGTPAEDRVAIDPFVGVTSLLRQRKTVEVLRVSATQPMYIRLVSLPTFDGVLWRPSTLDRAKLVAAGDPLPTADSPSGLADPVSIEVTANLAQNYVPTPYPMRDVDVPGRTIRFDASTGTTFVDEPLQEGDRYSVTSSIVRPTADALRAAGHATLIDGGIYINLPEDMPDEVRQMALDWTQDADTDFDKALAIQEHFRDTTQFRYDETTNLRGGTRSIVDFLTKVKAGFCQQFSTAMAVMLRELGIQSRVVVGFSTGNRTRAGGPFSVTTRQAHAWVEAYFPDWGWMPFEPTPFRTNPVTTGYTAPEQPACPGPGCVDDPTAQPATPAQQPGGPGGAQQQRVEQDPRLNGGNIIPLPAPPPIAEPEDPLSTARIALLVGAVLVVLALLLVPPWRALRRRLRMRRAAAEPRRAILVTYDVFTERAGALGLGRRHGETLEEYRRKVTDTGYLSNGHLDRLTRLTTQAAYGPREPDPAQAHEAGDAADTAFRELRRAVGPARWFVGLYKRS
ncbi:MAG TPA: transglutaminaseTgpA domain-containing protein [Actinomycetota bacterium]|nr:transglutaminaseTgpA domain-containing protein [Actinomycetota bacterium]